MTGCVLQALVLLALISPRAEASGSYVFRPVQAAAHDSIRYEMGKAIFLGRLPSIRESRAAYREDQERRLAAWQRQLPAKVRPAGDLTSLSGKLTTEQISALEYYLKVRYKVK